MALIQMVPGTVAKSADVNKNFASIMDILGALSTPGRVQTTTEFLMGARKNTLFTGTADTGVADASGNVHEYFQMGYNADFNLVSGSWKLTRFINNQGASLLRLGDAFFEIQATHETVAGLPGAMQTVFKIVRQEDDSFIYIPADISMTIHNETPTSIGDYRLNFVPLTNPGIVYEGLHLNKGGNAKDATDFGVSRYAKMIACNVLVEADSSDGDAQLRIMRNADAPSPKYGFTVTAGQNRRGSGFGFVPLGYDEYEHQFYIERTANFEVVTVYIMGYFV